MDIDSPAAELPTGEGSNAGASLTAGFMSGALNVLLGHPLDTLKVRLQVARIGPTVSVASNVDAISVVRGANSNTPFSPPISAPMNPLLSNVRQLYRGVFPPMVTTGAVQATYFVMYEHLKMTFSAKSSSIPHFYAKTFMCGSMAGFMISFVTNPVALVKVQLQTSANMTMLQCFRKLHSQNGFRGFYKGLSPMLLMESVGRGAFFSCYEYSKNTLSGGADESQLPMWCRMMAASIAGTLSWALIYPADVVKSRIQMAIPVVDSSVLVGGFVPIPTARAVLKMVYSEGGLRGLYRGLSLTLLRAAPISAIGLPLYEMCRNFISVNSRNFVALKDMRTSHLSGS